MLDPREGALFVTENAKNVKINSKNLEKMANELANKVKARDPQMPKELVPFELDCHWIPDQRETIFLEISMASSAET